MPEDVEHDALRDRQQPVDQRPPVLDVVAAVELQLDRIADGVADPDGGAGGGGGVASGRRRRASVDIGRLLPCRRRRRSPGAGSRESASRAGGSPASGVDLAAAFERAAERDLVGVLEVAADREPARDPGRPASPSGLSSRARYIAVASPSMLGLVARITSVTPSSSTRREQLLDPQLLGPDALDRRDRALEHVVATA